MPDIGSFAHGLVTGYGQGRQMRERRERHELEIAAKRDEQEMREAFKKINTDAKVDEQFAVRNADGDQVIYADRKEAEKAAGAPELVEPIYAVGGANYVSRDEADAASMILNSPMHRLKMQAEVANAYGRPDIAASLAKSHTALLDATRKSMQDAFITARQSGDIQTVLNARNELLASAGAQAQLFDDGTGGMILRTVDRNGDVVGEQHYATPEQMWDMMGQEMMETPDNALALWKARNDKAHQDRSFGLKEKATLHGMQMAEGQLANSRASVGIAGGQLALAREKFAADQEKPFALSTQVGEGVNDPQMHATVTGLQRSPEGGFVPFTTGPQPTGVMPRQAGGGLDLSGLLNERNNRPRIVFDGSRIPPRTPAAAQPAAAQPAAAQPVAPYDPNDPNDPRNQPARAPRGIYNPYAR